MNNKFKIVCQSACQPSFQQEILRPLKSLPENCHIKGDFPEVQIYESRRPKQNRKPKVSRQFRKARQTSTRNSNQCNVLPWRMSPPRADKSIHPQTCAKIFMSFENENELMHRAQTQIQKYMSPHRADKNVHPLTCAKKIHVN